MAIVMILFVCMLAAAAFLLGRVAVAQHELQTAADAFSRSLAISVQRSDAGADAASDPNLAVYFPQTIPTNHRSPLTAAPAVLRTNGGLNGPPWWEAAVTIQGQALSDSAGLTTLARIPVTVRSVARVDQNVVEDVQRLTPQVILALDYSSTMQRYFDPPRQRYKALQKAVEDVLDLDLEVDWGLVLFGAGVCREEPLGPNNAGIIRMKLAGSTCGAAAGGSGNTFMKRAMDRALNFFQRPGVRPWERFIIFGSDGYPEPASQNPRDSARQLRTLKLDQDDEGVSIYSFSLKTTDPGTSQMEAIMRQVAGEGGNDAGNDDSMAMVVTNTNQMRNLFQDTLAEVFCQTHNPLAPRAVLYNGEPRVWAFTRPRGTTNETRIIPDCGRPRVQWPPGCNNCPADPQCDPVRLMGSGKVRIEQQAICDLMEAGTHELVIRYNQPCLADPTSPWGCNR